jgi:hypothetical protein
MVKQPTSESSEFTMSSEDFPALPGTGSEGSGVGGVGGAGVGVVGGGVSGGSSGGGGSGGSSSGSDKTQGGGGESGGGSGGGGPGGGGPGGGTGPGSSTNNHNNTSPDSLTLQPISATTRPTPDKHNLKRGIQTSPDGMYNIVINCFYNFYLFAHSTRI